MTRTQVEQALTLIRPGHWVLYAASRSVSKLDKDAEKAKPFLMWKARKLEEAGRVMLLQKKEHGTYYLFARGIDPKVKKLVEAGAKALPRWAAVSLAV